MGGVGGSVRGGVTAAVLIVMCGDVGRRVGVVVMVVMCGDVCEGVMMGGVSASSVCCRCMYRLLDGWNEMCVV